MTRIVRLAILLCMLAVSIARREPLSKSLLLQGGREKKSKLEKSPTTVTSIIHSLIQRIRNLLSPKKTTIPISKKSAASLTYSGDSTQRIQRELKMFKENPPHNCEVSVGNSLRTWVVTLTGVEGSVYAGEKYKLKFVFPKDYPSRPPGVYFLKPVPRHQHVYSNGDICLNLLGKDWRPTMTAELIAVSILSMLSSAKEKKTPQDNALHADSPPGQKQENWMYHDDKC